MTADLTRIVAETAAAIKNIKRTPDLLRELEAEVLEAQNDAQFTRIVANVERRLSVGR